MRRRNKKAQLAHRKAYMRRYNRQHRKERRAYEEKYRQLPNVRARRNAAGKAYYKRNIERITAYRKAYRKRPASIKLNRILQARYRATPHAKEMKRRYEQTAKRKIARDAYYLKNRDRIRERMKQYYLKNYEKIWEKRRARKADYGKDIFK
jgi:hypothetical protein